MRLCWGKLVFTEDVKVRPVGINIATLLHNTLSSAGVDRDLDDLNLNIFVCVA
jgi:hypothetical protein